MSKKKKSKAEYIAEAVQYGLDVDLKMSISALKKMVAQAKKDSGRSDGKTPIPNPKHELFCFLFSGHQNRSLFGNATQCYLESHGGNARMEAIDNDLDNLYKKKKNDLKTAGSVLDKINKAKSEKKSIYNSANSLSARLLVNVSIRERCNFLINNFIKTDDDVDSELKFVIMQRFDMKSKVSAIKEYNRVQERVSEKVTGEIVMRWDDKGMGKKKKK